MKVKILTIFTMVLLVSAALAPGAMAQEVPGCGIEYEASYGNPFLSPTQGTAGSSFTVTGTLATVNADVTVWWDEAGTPQLLDTLTMDVNGNYSGSVTVPADAAPGIYTVALGHTYRDTWGTCLTFTVVAAVQTDAYTPALAAQGETPSVLPSTGLMLLVPAAGLASGAVGAAMLRRRRQ